jgi:hypothetical protein
LGPAAVSRVRSVVHADVFARVVVVGFVGGILVWIDSLVIPGREKRERRSGRSVAVPEMGIGR